MKLSIIIPVYNVEQYLQQCLDSVREQSYSDYEVICVDDGSTDGSAALLEEYAHKDERFRIVHQENQGMSGARNTGVATAKGTYIYFLDSDDFLGENILELCCQRMEQETLDVLVGGASVFYEDAALEEKFAFFKEQYQFHGTYEGVYRGPELIKKLRENKDYFVPVPTKMFRRDFLLQQKLTFIPGQIHEDEIYTLRSLFMADRVAVLPQPLYYRRIRKDSAMTTKTSPDNVSGYLIDFIEATHFLEAEQERYPLDPIIGISVKGALSNGAKRFLELEEEQQRSYEAGLSPQQRYYFNVYLEPYIRLQQQRDDFKEKLTQTYEEKSEINAKLQKTYKEKFDRGVRIRELEEQLAAVTQQRDAVVNSKAYRYGQKLLWLPKRLKAGWKKDK